MTLKEEVNPSFNVDRGLMDVNVDAVRDNINILITGVTECSTVTPYIALERVRKVLAQFHIFLPKVTFLEGEHGVQTFEINQFGEMMGMRNDGTVVTKTEYPYHLYFEYQMNDRGMFDVFSEIVNKDELNELLDDVDEESMEDEREDKLDESSESVDMAGPETGSRPIDGAPPIGMNILHLHLKKKKKLNEARGLPKEVLSAMRLMKQMEARRKGKKLPTSKAKKQTPTEEKKVKNIAKKLHASMQTAMEMAKAAEEFEKVRQGPHDFEKYKEAYHKHQNKIREIRKK